MHLKDKLRLITIIGINVVSHTRLYRIIKYIYLFCVFLLTLNNQIERYDNKKIKINNG